MLRCFRIFTLVGLFALAYGLPGGWAADLPIGVVEPQKVLDGTKVGRKIKDALADYVNTRQRLIESEEQDIKAMEEDLVKQGDALSPEAKQEKEAVIHQKLLAYRRHVQELEGEVQAKKRELLSDFTKKIEQVVREIAEKEMITLVMEKGDAGLGALIMYSEPSIDLTDLVIKALESKGGR
ncbi:MAG TPA: OmpH family outer membrane protein [Nitrospirales bacterium]|nr:OmpH family outer membrane protein [Nitrospirales bacterium]